VISLVADIATFPDGEVVLIIFIIFTFIIFTIIVFLSKQDYPINIIVATDYKTEKSSGKNL